MSSPRDLVHHAPPGSTVVGWKLDRDQRAALLRQFVPTYPRVIADHVTLAAKVPASTPLPPPVACELVGRVDDGRGVEALVASIDGQTARPDGSTYHVTWSLAAGRMARESNDLLASRPWKAFDHPIPVIVAPARWP